MRGHLGVVFYHQSKRVWRDLNLPAPHRRFATYDEWLAAFPPLPADSDLHAVCDAHRWQPSDTLCRARLAAARHRISFQRLLPARPAVLVDLPDEPTDPPGTVEDGEVVPVNVPAPPHVDVTTLVAAPSAPPHRSS